MQEDQVAELGREYHELKAKLDRVRDQLRDAILADAKKGARTMDLARRSGYEREIIRRILKKARDAGELPPLSD